MTTIGESIGRIRQLIKANTQDAFVTDRFIYSLILKYAKLYIKRQDGLNYRLKLQSLFTSIKMDLTESNIVEAQCSSLPKSTRMMRTIEKVPAPLEGAYGALIRSVTSIDASNEIYRTSPAAYASIAKSSSFKYNKNKYYWYANGYLYFPNVDWPFVLVDGIFDKDLSVFTCDKKDECKIRQEFNMPIPDDLFAEIEKQVLQDLGFNLQVPTDPKESDKQNPIR